jgi:hypothetical protein
MKSLKVEIDKSQLDNLLAEITPGDGVILTDGDRQIALELLPHFDPNEDSPELEAELLKAANGPFSDYSRADLEEIAARVRAEKRHE